MAFFVHAYCPRYELAPFHVVSLNLSKDPGSWHRDIGVFKGNSLANVLSYELIDMPSSIGLRLCVFSNFNISQPSKDGGFLFPFWVTNTSWHFFVFSISLFASPSVASIDTNAIDFSTSSCISSKSRNFRKVKS